MVYSPNYGRKGYTGGVIHAQELRRISPKMTFGMARTTVTIVSLCRPQLSTKLVRDLGLAPSAIYAFLAGRFSLESQLTWALLSVAAELAVLALLVQALFFCSHCGQPYRAATISAREQRQLPPPV